MCAMTHVEEPFASIFSAEKNKKGTYESCSAEEFLLRKAHGRVAKSKWRIIDVFW